MAAQVGIPDPLAWAATVDESVIDWWAAFYQVEPYGQQWEQTAKICDMLERLIAMEIAKCGKSYKPVGWKGHMPVMMESKEPKQERLMDANTEAIFNRIKSSPKYAEAKRRSEAARVSY